MGHRLLDLDWVVNFKCFLSGSFISCQELRGVHFWDVQMLRCPMTLRVVRRTFWTQANGRPWASTSTRSRPSPPSSSAAWRSSSRSWTRWIKLNKTPASRLIFTGCWLSGRQGHRWSNREQKLPCQADDWWNLRGLSSPSYSPPSHENFNFR